MTLLGICLKKSNNTSLKRYMHPNVHSSIIYNCQGWKQPKCPSTDEWINRSGIYTHTHNGIQSAIKKNKIFPFAASGMDLEGIMLSEICQTEKDKYCMISLTCGI